MLVWVQVPSPAVEKSRKSETGFLLFLCKHAGRATNLPAVSDRIGKGRNASMSRRLPGKKLCAYDDEIQV